MEIYSYQNHECKKPATNFAFFIASVILFTLEPEQPILMLLCTVIIWVHPRGPDWEIQHYELKLIHSNGQEERFTYRNTDNFHLTTEEQMQDNMLFQVNIALLFFSYKLGLKKQSLTLIFFAD